jgi:hypothetical protein
MRINLNRRDSPDNVLDIYPENSEDGAMILEFLSNFASRQDIPRVNMVGVTSDHNPSLENFKDLIGIIISVE